MNLKPNVIIEHLDRIQPEWHSDVYLAEPHSSVWSTDEYIICSILSHIDGDVYQARLIEVVSTHTGLPHYLGVILGRWTEAEFIHWMDESEALHTFIEWAREKMTFQMRYED